MAHPARSLFISQCLMGLAGMLASAATWQGSPWGAAVLALTLPTFLGLSWLVLRRVTDGPAVVPKPTGTRAPILVRERRQDEVLSALAQEMGVPLNALVGYLSLLTEEREGASAPLETAMARGAEACAARLRRQLDNLQLYARIQTGRLTLMPRADHYAAIAEHALEEVRPEAEAKGLRLTSEVRAPDAVYLDGERIAQALLQVLDSAVKYAPAGGRIVLRAYVRGADLVTEILGDSPVVAPPRLELAVARGIVEAHGGLLAQGDGAMFRFRLPDALVPLAA